MEILAILGIIVAIIIFRARELNGWVVAGLTALFFVIAILMLMAFIFVPPLSDWSKEFLESDSGAWGLGQLVVFFCIAGGISCLISLAVVLVLTHRLKKRRRRVEHSVPRE